MRNVVAQAYTGDRMTDPITPQPSDSTDFPAATDPVTADEVSGGSTQEEIEAYWRRRVMNKDKGHAAAERALREELESARKRPTLGADGQPGNGVDPNAAEVEALRREIAAKDALYGRKSKYPNLNGNVSDLTIMSSDEADLAKFNALFDDSASGGTFIAPTAPKRTASPGQKRIEDMSKDELLLELQRETTKMTEDRRGY